MANLAASSSLLPGLEQFDCIGDTTSVGVRWEKWKRALDIYLLATGITESVKKRAILLHFGRIALQDVYHLVHR